MDGSGAGVYGNCKTPTPSGRQVTFEASRSEEVSHADLAWACMHAIINEPLESPAARTAGGGLIKVYG